MEKEFKWMSSVVCYQVLGNGPTAMIAFHGYAQNSRVFNVFNQFYENKYTVYSIDLPFQGKTQWNEPGKLNAEALTNLICAFLKEMNLPESEKIALMGYSLGGNYTLGFVCAMPERIKEVYLLAADGIARRLWFHFFTKTWLGLALFQGFIHFPQPVFGLIRLLTFVGLYHVKIKNFFIDSISTKEKRRLLMQRWRSSSNIHPGIRKVISTLKKSEIPTFLLFGKKDKLIDYRNAVALHKKLITVHIRLLDQGHELVKQSNVVHLEELYQEHKNIKPE
ncbi:MAG: pimeloyl-ACP methyl ester carboxylesterase [Bacteroidia bacterium]